MITTLSNDRHGKLMIEKRTYFSYYICLNFGNWANLVFNQKMFLLIKFLALIIVYLSNGFPIK